MVNIQWDSVLFFALGMLLLYGIGWLFTVPSKLIARLLGNAVLGGVALYGIGLLAPYTGVAPALNVLTALIVGILGLPGAVLVTALTAVL